MSSSEVFAYPNREKHASAASRIARRRSASRRAALLAIRHTMSRRDFRCQAVTAGTPLQIDKVYLLCNSARVMRPPLGVVVLGVLALGVVAPRSAAADDRPFTIGSRP